MPAVAVYTRLDETFVREMLAVYDVGDVVAMEGVAAGSINTMYEVRTTAGTVFLRVNEGKLFADVVHEKDLLLHLDAAANALGGVRTPRMARNAAGGWFFPVQGRQACVFEKLAGRELGVFELAPDHVRQVGAFLARAHRATATFAGRRANPYRLPVVARWIERLVDDPGADEVAPLLARALRRVRGLRRRGLPRGLVHGDLFVDNAKWRDGTLVAVFDWEMAGRDHLALDVGVALNAWCWRRDGQGGGAFDGALCAALVEGYRSVRPLRPVEIRGLYAEACFAALRFTTSRVRDFHLPAARARGDRLFLDWRDFAARLEALFAMGPRGFRSLVRLPASTDGLR